MSLTVLFLMGTSTCVSGVTNTLVNASNSQTPHCNKTPVNNCNCQCTVNQDLRFSHAMKSLEAKMESLLGLKNKTSGVSDALKFLGEKMESLIRLNGSTSGVSDAMKSIGTKMESLNGLNNKTSGLSDAVKSLKAKVESLIGWINKTLTSQPAPKPTGFYI